MDSRFMRQLGIFNPSEYSYGINIVGCGGIGTAVGITLAKMGLKRFSLWDMDKIDEHNLPNQMFNNASIRNNKTVALKNMMESFGHNISVTWVTKKLTICDFLPYPITMVCTDSISSRKKILKVAIKSKCKLLIDGRMSGRVFRVFTVDLTKRKEIKKYRESFHEDTEQSCTERAIMYNIFGVSSIMANQLIKIFRNEKYPREINFCYQNYIMRCQ